MTDEEFTTIKIVFAEILSQLESYDDEIFNSLWLAFLGIDRETYDDPKTEKIRAEKGGKRYLTKEEIDDFIFDKILHMEGRVLACEKAFGKYMLV